MDKRVVITGMGCVSPLGNDSKTTWENILAGKSGGGMISAFDTTDFKVKVAAEVKDFSPESLFGKKESRRMDRVSHFALASALEAKENSNLDINDDNRDRIGVVIGSGVGGQLSLQNQFEVYFEKGPKRVSPFLVPMLMPNNPGGTIAIQLGLRGSNMAVVTACATGTNSIGESVEIIRRNQADVMFAGGTEAGIIPILIGGFSAMKALTSRNDDPQGASRPFDRDRDGFLMGEGAGVIVLESLEHAQERGANILAELVGYGSTNDAYHISAPAENGEGAARCMNMALEHSGLELTDIDYINAHGTSTILNDINETAAIKTVFGESAYDIPISSTKSMTGHLMGSAGALEVIFCVKALQDNIIPPTINYENPDPLCDLDYVPNTLREKSLNNIMTNSFGFGGHNATLIISKYQNGENS